MRRLQFFMVAAAASALAACQSPIAPRSLDEPGAAVSGEDEPLHHRYRHVALQVTALRPVLHLLLDHGQRVFQTGFDGVEKEITSRDDTLEFGIGSIFVRDPDGNLIEVLQPGHGIFDGRTGEDA